MDQFPLLALLTAFALPAGAAPLPSTCAADPNPAVEWRDIKNIQGPVWDSLDKAGFKDRWSSLCPSERLMAAYNVHIKGNMPNLETKRGCDSEVYKKQMAAFETYLKGLGTIDADQRYQRAKQEFDVLCAAYQTRVRQNRAAAWGYGWMFDFRPDKSADWTVAGPVPETNDGSRSQGICTEWAEDISKSLAGPWAYWTVAPYDRTNGASHTAVAVCPKTTAEVNNIPNSTSGLLCERGLGFILDPWTDGKAELFTPTEFNDVSNGAAVYAEIMDPVAAFNFYKNWAKKKF